MKRFTLLILAFAMFMTFSCEEDEDKNEIPIANAGSDLISFVGDTITMDGSGSSDLDNQDLTYLWSIISKPTNSNASLSNLEEVNPVLIPDIGGDYIVQLIVNDGETDSNADSAKIYVKDIDGTWASMMVISGGPFDGRTEKDTLIIKSDFENYESYQYFDFNEDFYMTTGHKGTSDYDHLTKKASIIVNEAYMFNWDFSSPHGTWYTKDDDPYGVVVDYQSMFVNGLEFLLLNQGDELTVKGDFNEDGDYDEHGETMTFTRVE